MTWHIPPANQGQMIEIAYASDGEFLYRRIRDRSAGTEQISRVAWEDLADIAPEVTFEPWNDAPVVPRDAWHLFSMTYEVTDP